MNVVPLRAQTAPVTNQETRLTSALGNLNEALQQQNVDIAGYRKSLDKLDQSIKTLEKSNQEYIRRLDQVGVRTKKLRGKAQRLARIASDWEGGTIAKYAGQATHAA